MKPVTFAHVEAGIPKNKLLLLNPDLAVALWLRELVSQGGPASIRSQGGLALPLELWIGASTSSGRTDEFTHILDAAVKYATKRRKLCFVKTSLVSSPYSPALPTGVKLLRCVRHEFENQARLQLAGNLRNPGSVMAFLSFLNDATDETAAEINARTRDTRANRQEWLYDYICGCYVEIPKLCALSGPGNVFYTIHRYDAPVGYLTGLYRHVTVPDIISRIEGGSCWACRRDRLISLDRWPTEDNGGVNWLVAIPDQYWGVRLACPLCLGLKLYYNHLQYRKAQRRGDTTEEDNKRMRKKIHAQLAKLRYYR
ncbi:hypothetical protein MMYC01_205980 [Madurella mycetomatis]|uniref:Uncharacterized protein n=1 Tax=Madurella mycetomatis TaxID=100816 RepID=A0A175W1M3_9PEZI|nr:hypothetical protein MMYC01_205980 [Madurella mycetomatis]